MLRLLIPFLFLAVTVSAQAPGYMGKKWTVGYGAFTNFNIGDPYHDNAVETDVFDTADVSPSAFNLVHELSIQRAIADEWSVTGSFRYFRTTYNNQEVLFDIRNRRPSGYYSITGTAYALTFRKYSRKYVAPWGPYFLFGPVVNVNYASYDPYMHVRVELFSHDTLLTDFGSSTQRFISFDLMLGFGKARVIARTLVLDYGFVVQPIAAVRAMSAAVRSTPVLYMDNYIEKTHQDRVDRINYFNLFLRLSYLF